MFEIKSLVGRVHDTSFGGYPFKIIATITITTKEFNKLPVLRREAASMFGGARVVRKLGELVLAVNNKVYAVNNNIPAYYPSIDPEGSKRAVKGIKTMIFEYFIKDLETAERLGFNVDLKRQLIKSNDMIDFLSK